MTVETVELDAAEVEQMRADLASVRQQNAALREVNVRLGRAEAENDQLNRAVTAIVGERDTARAEAKELGNELAEERAEHQATGLLLTRARDRLADCEAALVEANSARRLSNAEHLHQRLTAATLVIGRWQDWRYCPLCREVTEVKGARHACGRMVPVDVIIARRPNPPTTEEQP